MGLAALQAALARLATDPAARAELRVDPAAFASRCGLSEEDAAALAGDLGGEIQAFARALRQKRMREAMNAMPLAAPMLGARCAALFHEYADATPLGRARNPALDALAFHEWLLKRGTLADAEADTLRYEAAWLIMQNTVRRWMFRWLLPPGSGRASRAIVVWWRWRGSVRHWVSG